MVTGILGGEYFQEIYYISKKNGDLLGGFNPFEEILVKIESFSQVGMNI